MSVTKTRRALLQALWRKAFTTGEELRVECKDVSSAIRLRFELYHAVKKHRETGEFDRELHEAANGCMVGREGGVVVIRKRELEDGLLAAAAMYGLTPEMVTLAPETAEESRIAESARKLQERLAGAGGKSKTETPGEDAASEHRKTRYYTR